MLVFFTLLTFANSWHDALVFDDKMFVGPGSEQRLDSLSEAFTRDVWNSGSGLYRPLLLIDIELQSRWLGESLPGYHLANILLHLLTTLTLFGFLRYLLRTFQSPDETSDFYALLAALTFAVHPAHTEVINSVFNKSSMYVSLAAITGLWWLLSNLKTRPARGWIGLGLIYSIAVLFKESALILPGIAVAMIVLVTEGPLKARVRRCLPVFWLLIPIALYFWIRTTALATVGGEEASETNALISLLEQTRIASETQSLAGIATFGRGLAILAWPYPLRLYYPEPGNLAYIAYISAQFALGGWAVYLLAKGRPMLIFSLVFYYLALLPSIRLITIDSATLHLSERYLYFPSVGLAIALAFGLRALAVRAGRRTLVIVMLPLLLVLATISWDRNAQWKSEVLLFETEYQLSKGSNDALRILVAAHHKYGRHERVAEICDENRLEFRKSYQFAFACLSSYLHQERLDDGLAALQEQAMHGRGWLPARLSLASLYQLRKQYQQVVEQYADIIERTVEPALKDFYKGEMLLAVYPDDREQLELARRLFQQALAQNPDLDSARMRIERIDRKLTNIDALSAPADSK